ncbi:uncharacterized protein PHACADRAFT_205840 [Phanerochaete carnosa HHB-10118-sp]|uniref:Uncharacterized protein n=1 Tax=Phanerochaete carnosa (strain HHB-10118-sp) TaxID=650164 RepID=K5V9T2_PHACS|nr:uncharacterized protein PHACADRAFT_205840 [Phanerochaete carnosa HHB-10118-sp]EKM59616.1 hypothetical protein PHACADRAFT_205840 [Phanerochaete carnosa HHB-10118-sp]
MASALAFTRSSLSMTMSSLRVVSIGRLFTARPLLANRHITLPSRLHMYIRQFSISPVRTTEIPNKSQVDTIMKALQGSKAWSKVSDNQKIQQMYAETVQVMIEEGMGAKPSPFMLLTNSRVREQIKKIAQALQAAGLDAESMKELAEIAQNALKEEENKR